jgi:hypothetical protein
MGDAIHTLLLTAIATFGILAEIVQVFLRALTRSPA